MANIRVEEEIEALKKFIKKLGQRNEKGQYVVTFGVLFDDDEAANTFEAMVGTLRSAKKRKIIKFKGQMLLKGMHDNVPIILLQGDDDYEEENGDDTKTNMNAVSVADIAHDSNAINKTKLNITNKKAATTPIKIMPQPQQQKLESVNNNNGNKMVEARGRCNESGCKCDEYVENPSKWSKGKCNTCNHPPIRHKQQWIKAGDIESAVKGQEQEQEQEQEQGAVAAESDLENKWGQAFTAKLGECVNDTFEYDEESILPAKYLLYYLKKRIGFDFGGQSQQAEALKFVFVDKFGWKIVHKWGYSVRVRRIL